MNSSVTKDFVVLPSGLDRGFNANLGWTLSKGKGNSGAGWVGAWVGGSLLDQHIVCIRECAAFLPGDTQREIKPREGTHWRLWTALERERERDSESKE